jgi:hypothetical protein
VGSCECGNEPSGSGITDLVRYGHSSIIDSIPASNVVHFFAISFILCMMSDFSD